jgi:hypothetical protein
MVESPGGTHVNRQGGMFLPEMQPLFGMLKKNHIQSFDIAFL